MSEKKLNLSTRLVATCTIEFDCGSEYGGQWTFEEAYKDAKRAAQNIAQGIAQHCDRVVTISLGEIKSVTLERK